MALQPEANEAPRMQLRPGQWVKSRVTLLRIHDFHRVLRKYARESHEVRLPRVIAIRRNEENDRFAGAYATKKVHHSLSVPAVENQRSESELASQRFELWRSQRSGDVLR